MIFIQSSVKPISAQPRAMTRTENEATDRSLKMKNGTSTASQTSTPPIVGVPSLILWPSGPSSRMVWPNSLRRSHSMKAGPTMRITTIDVMPAASALNISARRPFGAGQTGPGSLRRRARAAGHARP